MARICIFGDSIAFGRADTELMGWVARLQLDFSRNPKTTDYRIFNLGVDGDTTADLIVRMQIETSSREPEIIIIAIGINDSRYIEKEGHMETPIDQFKTNLKKILKIAKSATNSIAFVGLTPIDENETMPIPWKTDLFYTAENMKIYNSVLEKFCTDNKVDFISMENIVLINELTDGLHPNSEGHKKMAERIKNHLLTKLYAHANR